MGKSVLIMGPSGSGKSTSLRNLDPEKTIVFGVLAKGLPFPGSQKMYHIYHKDENPKGNYVVTSHVPTITAWLQAINKKRPEITTCIIDDNTFATAKELDRRRDELGYKKFSDIAHDFLTISEVANTLRPDLNVYFLHHVREEGDGIMEDKTVKAMSYGKMIDDKLASIEAQFEIVLLASKLEDKDHNLVYKFKTRDAKSTAKSPMGMFKDEYIDNDLAMINEVVYKYYNEPALENAD